MNQSRSALLVDDERDIRDLLTLTPRPLGQRIDTAEAQQAWEDFVIDSVLRTLRKG